MDRVIKKVTETDPFLPEEHKFKKPLYAALVPDEIFKGSHFERRFVTPFGTIWEKLAKAVAMYSTLFFLQFCKKLNAQGKFFKIYPKSIAKGPSCFKSIEGKSVNMVGEFTGIQA